MAANESGPPALVNIGIPIPQTLATLDDIFNRRQDRKAAPVENFFANLRDDLEVIDTAVKALDDKFIALVVAYSDKDIIGDPVRLKELGKETKQYLTVSEIVPRLELSMGAIEGVAKNPNIAVPGHGLITVPAQLQIILTELSGDNGRLVTYRNNLRLGVTSGIGWEWLLQLYNLAEKDNWKPNAKGEEDILALAYTALNVYTFELSGQIHRLVGQARLYC